ncbi:dihydrodipicolinate synthase family protein [Mesorhizobium sp. 113-3-3]|uniref:dihydrodipicolinate synthase family protein n=1 Tax=Mesorhizobium sp. 113-3-3 TaxID=2744516 RepID=UPI00192821C0|nr:dihydrodipicolinate synthase family protein [Mesorhizobium sp. 113-3-3]BCG82173.1 4-hydroxy-tetrahydrodipicolinate synthase [Mesorhizobium sp. 113-3-3]
MTKKSVISGIITAMLTPFRDNDVVDYDAVAGIVERQIGAGAGGILVAGSTGEFFTLSNAERRSLLEITTNVSGGRLPIIANSSAPSTRETVQLSQHAQQGGAVATLVMPWSYEPMPEQALIKLYEDVASSIDIPVVIYDAPVATRLHLTTEQRVRLGEIPGVDFIKLGSPNFVDYWDLLQTKDRKIELVSACDTLTFSNLAAGSPGVISGAPNIFPELWVALFNMINVEGDVRAARTIWDVLWPICHFLDRNPYVSTLKAAAAHLGNGLGEVRRPLLPLPEDAVMQLGQTLDAVANAAHQLALPTAA